MRFTAVVCLAVAGLAFAQLAQQRAGRPEAPSQPPAAPRADAVKSQAGSVSGQVVNSVSGEPIRKANVSLVGAGGGRGGVRQYGAQTDPQGNFKIENVEPGAYQVRATRTGFVGGSSRGGRQGVRGGAVGLQTSSSSFRSPTIKVGGGEHVKGFVIDLTPAGVIAGRVVDEDGDAVQFASVQVMRWTYVQGRRQMVPAGNDQTNDLGEYRISGIQPGRYVLAVTRDRGPNPRLAPQPDDDGEPDYEYVPMYYPAVLDAAAATPIRITPGTEMLGMDFRLQKATVFRVRGTVRGFIPSEEERGGPRGGPGPMGMRMGGAIVMLQDLSSGAFSRLSRRPAAVRRDGTFEITGVMPGAYVLTAQQGSRELQLSTRLLISVGRADLEGIELHLQPSARLKGRVIVQGGQPPGQQPRLMVQFAAMDDFGSGSGAARVNPEDGTFESNPLAPGQYRVIVQPLPEGYYLRSVRWGDQEVAESGFQVASGAAGEVQVALAPGAARISGTVRDGGDQPAPGAIVTLVPEARFAGWTEHYRYAAAGDNGEFQFPGLRPGTYKIHAWEELENGQHMDPEFMRQFDGAGLSVTLKPGANETVQMGVIPASAVAGR